jgi:membrane associated rhomboid family serine protease
MTKPTDTIKESKIRQIFVRHARYIMVGILLVFTLAAVLLGEVFDLYNKIWWWDDALHGLSGIIFGLLGLFVVYGINRRADMRIVPSFVALFVVCFAMAAGVVWEIFEFVSDVSFKTTMQQWNEPKDAIVIGKDYQGMGLRDTMSDLIVASIGALAAGLFSYVAYDRRRSTLIDIMRHTFPSVKKKR